MSFPETVERAPPLWSATGAYLCARSTGDSIWTTPASYRRTGKRVRAREHLTTATTMYREMEMRFWLEQAEAELRRWHDDAPR